jgi:hypothetical protein
LIDWPAVAWVVIAAIGAVIAAIAVREGLADYRSLGAQKNGRRIIARGYLRSQSFLFILETIWVVIGIPVVLDDHVTPLNPVVVGLIGTSALLAIQSFLNLRDRRRVLRSLAR